MCSHNTKQEKSDIPLDFIETLKRTEQIPLTSVISSVMKGKKKGSREKNVEWSLWETSEVAKENSKVFKNSLPHPLNPNVIMSSLTSQKPGKYWRRKKCAIICKNWKQTFPPLQYRSRTACRWSLSFSWCTTWAWTFQVDSELSHSSQQTQRVTDSA